MSGKIGPKKVTSPRPERSDGEDITPSGKETGHGRVAEVGVGEVGKPADDRVAVAGFDALEAERREKSTAVNPLC